MLAAWAEEKGRGAEGGGGRASWNLDEGASSEKGAHKDGQFWEGGEAPCPPVATDLFAQYSEGSRGRREAEEGEWEGEWEGGEKEEGGEFGQKIDMSSDHPPFLCRHGGQISPHPHCGDRVLGGNQLHSLRRQPWAKG